MSSVFELNPTFSFTLLGTFVIYLWTRPSRPALLAVVIGAIGLRVACIRLMGGLGSYYGVSWITWGAFLGITSMMVLAVQMVRSRRRSTDAKGISYRQAFYSGAVFPLCSLLVGDALPATEWLRPRTYDAYLLAFDGSLGFQPSFVLARLLPVGSNRWGLMTVAYYALPLVVCTLYASHLASNRAGKRQPVLILALFLSMMVAGFVPYLIYPAAGPLHAFAGFYPGTVPLLNAIQPMSVPGAPRNCMPSLHLAGALAVWRNSRLWPRLGRLLAALFLFATILSTLSLGEHYLADLIVAVPFTMIFQAAWTVAVPLTASVRRVPIVVGTILTAGWIALLRYGLDLFRISPVIPWSLCLLTIGSCLALEKRLSDSAATAKAALDSGS
ncbi:MAG TPA: phosphatase PAP2 family protein [Terriglobales bacterium]|nr:phosphatase PAP2 family protein [Terriglobales bacterium]